MANGSAISILDCVYHGCYTSSVLYPLALLPCVWTPQPQHQPPTSFPPARSPCHSFSLAPSVNAFSLPRCVHAHSFMSWCPVYFSQLPGNRGHLLLLSLLFILLLCLSPSSLTITSHCSLSPTPFTFLI